MKSLSSALSMALEGLFRAYDLLGVRPSALISIEVARSVWPHCLRVNDINLAERSAARHWANLFPRVKSVHIWGCFPRVHLSSARNGRLNFAGEGSNLSFQLVQVIEFCLPAHFVVETCFPWTSLPGRQCPAVSTSCLSN